ncbi:MAG: hypothetical protein WED04_00450 [Promethearchaeati archaeon SRVP18_Atabeyarchaeia-1]
MDEKEIRTQPASHDVQLQESTEKHRYVLAMVFIGSFMLIMGLAVLATIFWGYTGIANLVGFFSGWVAAVIGFYFLQQNVAGAQAIAKVAADQAARQSALVSKLVEDKSKLLSQTSLNIIKADTILDQISYLKKQIGEGQGKLGEQVLQDYQKQLEALWKEVKERLTGAREAIDRYAMS